MVGVVPPNAPISIRSYSKGSFIATNYRQVVVWTSGLRAGMCGLTGGTGEALGGWAEGA